MGGDVLSRTMPPCHMTVCSVSLSNSLPAFEVGTCVAGPRGIQQEQEGELSTVATVAICVLSSSCCGQIYFLILISLIPRDVALL